MVVLLVADHVDHLVDRIVLIAQLGGAYILRHVDRSTVGTQQQLVVEAVGSEVGPYRAVILAVHDAFFEPLKHLFLTFEVGLALVVYLVEIDSHTLVCLVETGIYP